MLGIDGMITIRKKIAIAPPLQIGIDDYCFKKIKGKFIAHDLTDGY